MEPQYVLPISRISEFSGSVYFRLFNQSQLLTSATCIVCLSKTTFSKEVHDFWICFCNTLDLQDHLPRSKGVPSWKRKKGPGPIVDCSGRWRDSLVNESVNK